jgi:hypothetical protein
LPHVGVNILNAHTNSAIEKSLAQSPLKDLPAMGCITVANGN